MNNTLNQILLKTILTRTVPYDDVSAEFVGGPMEKMTKTGYEKGLKNLWKANVHVPDLGFNDASTVDKLNLKSLNKETLGEIEQMVGIIQKPSFKTRIQELSPEQRTALAKILSVLLHGEAAAFWVSASLIGKLKGTGTQAALSCQVLEETKHFLVLRELIKQIDKVYPQRYWDKLMLERVAAAEPINRLFGMNVLLEGVALNFFSAFAHYPGLDEILPLFHLDESRHTALPHSYAECGAVTYWDKHSPVKQFQRLMMVLPLLGLLFDLEEDARVLGIDIFEFGGKCVDKIFRLSERSGFYLPVNRLDLIRIYNVLIASYRKFLDTENFNGLVDLTADNTIQISEQLKKIEDEIFGTDDKLRGLFNRATEPVKLFAYSKLETYLK